MKIYSDGQSRVLNGKFPKNFKLMQNGVEVPFIRTGADSVRLSGQVPVGDIDILEVIKEQVMQRPSLTADAKFVMVNANEADRLEKLGADLDEKRKMLEKASSDLEERSKDIVAWENKNADAIKEMDGAVSEMVGNIQKEIESNAKQATDIKRSLSKMIGERVEDVNDSLIAHEESNNPHKITKATIGLDKVENIAPSDMPISKATKEALSKKADKDDLKDLKEKIEESGKAQEEITKGLDRLSYMGGVGGNELPVGGKKGQLLAKGSDQAGDYKWIDPESGIEIVRVEELPASGESGKLYLVPSSDPEASNIYDEYIWTDDGTGTYAFEKIGTTEIDLSEYQKKTTVVALADASTITLASNTIYNGGTLTALTIQLPAGVDNAFTSEIDFTSGSTATTFSYPNTLKWIEGDDVASQVFTPDVNKRYICMIIWDGTQYVGTVRGVE